MTPKKFNIYSVSGSSPRPNANGYYEQLKVFLHSDGEDRKEIWDGSPVNNKKLLSHWRKIESKKPDRNGFNKAHWIWYQKMRKLSRLLESKDRLDILIEKVLRK